MRSLVQRLLPALLCLLALALTAPPAQAARGHVFEVEGKSITIGEPCKAGEVPCGPGKLKEPSGVAVNEASGDVYVIDTGNSRVERFNSKGEIQSELKGPAATGSGKLTASSSTIEEALATTGAFSVGETIEGEGIPAGTEITAVPSPGVLTISNPVEAGGPIPVALTAHQTFSFPVGNPLAETSGIAVDNTCSLPGKASEEACKTDPSAGDVYVIDAGHAVIDKFKPIPGALEYVGQLTGTCEGENESPPCPGSHVVPFKEIDGVAVDSSGTLWVSESAAEFGHEGVDQFSNAAANRFVSFRATTQGPLGPGVAVDSEDNLYLTNSIGVTIFNRIAEYSGTENGACAGTLVCAKVVKIEVGPETATGVATEFPSNDVYIDDGATLARFDQAGVGLERLEVPGGHGGGGAVAVSSATETVFVADAVGGVVDVASPEPPGPPTVTAGSDAVSEVASESAVFSARVEPRSEPGEHATEYRFEYGPCSSTPASCASSPYSRSVPEPEGRLVASFGVDTVTANPQDLMAHTVYHFRVLAHNGHPGTPGHPEVAEGEEVIFTTQGAGGEFALPDGRQWELVSPPDKHGGVLEPIGGGGVPQGAAGGGAFSYLANAPTEPEPAGDSNSVQVLSTRGPGGWSSRDIAPPHAGATGVSPGQGQEYRFFSEDLSLGVLQPFGGFAACRSGEGAAQACISAEASEQTAFLRTNYTSPGVVCESSCYRPLVTGAPGHENVPPGTKFGETIRGGGPCPPALICGPQFVGASPDASHVVLKSTVALTAGGASGLYEWAAGGLAFIGRGQLGQQKGGESVSARHAVSDDGSRVFFEGGSEGLEGLLMRDLPAGKTVKLDSPQAGCGACGSGGGVFQIASADGSRVFFTDEQRLTENAGAEPKKPDLYVCEIVADACQLTDLTPPAGGEPASVRGGVLGASVDGSSVYFVANGVQGKAPGAAHGTCDERAVGAVCNVYRVQREGSGWGSPRLVAVISEEDRPDWNIELNHQPTRVSPSGEWLAFMSERSLTGYDNRDAVSGKPDEEVFLFHASTGALVCASCDPTGARPEGRLIPDEPSLFAGTGVWPHRWLAGNVPGWTPYSLGLARYQSRYLSDSGRLFFNSSDPLVPADVGGTEDVYQYEPEGVGGCTSTPAGNGVVVKPGGPFKDVEGREGTEGAGCVGLISSGRSSGDSGFLDASASGNDVFFLTSAKLTSQDYDTSLDVYDAHVCTTESPCTSAPTSPPPCTNESSCKPSPTPQPGIFGPPASATFSGPGNLGGGGLNPTPPPAKPTAAQLKAKKLAAALTSCRKKYKHSKTRRASCERKARKQYGPLKKAKKK
jgi:hypothetical protein